MTRPDDYPNTPELDKFEAVSDYSQLIGEFLEWYRDEEEEQSRQPIEHVLAAYYNIDLKKVEQERREILSYLQKEYEGQ